MPGNPVIWITRRSDVSFSSSYLSFFKSSSCPTILVLRLDLEVFQLDLEVRAFPDNRSPIWRSFWIEPAISLAVTVRESTSAMTFCKSCKKIEERFFQERIARNKPWYREIQFVDLDNGRHIDQNARADLKSAPEKPQQHKPSPQRVSFLGFGFTLNLKITTMEEDKVISSSRILRGVNIQKWRGGVVIP